MILAIRSDTDQAELYLLDGQGAIIDQESWTAGRNLARDILGRIQQLLGRNQADFASLEGVAMYEGPGSFTGLRIGMSVGNAIAYAQDIPAVAAAGDKWRTVALEALVLAQPGHYPTPRYGRDPNITKPKK